MFCELVRFVVTRNTAISIKTRLQHSLTVVKKQDVDLPFKIESHQVFIKSHFSSKVSDDSRFVPLAERASNVGIESRVFLKYIKSCPHVLNTSPDIWERYLTLFVDNGFSPNDYLHMTSVYPKILSLRSENILESLNCWRDTQLGEVKVIYLLRTQPQLLHFTSQISHLLPILKSLDSSKQIVNLLISEPNIMFQKKEKLMEKITYIENDMGINKKNIVRSFALNRSISFLQMRHTFLKRCGVYKEQTKDLTINLNNPSLSSIADTTDIHFANKIAGLTLEEYEVFQDMYYKYEIDEDDESDMLDNEFEE